MGPWGARILVVDRDPESVAVVRALMVPWRARVAGVASCAEALASMREYGLPDVLLVDIAVAGPEGFATMREVRTLAPERGGLVPAASMGPSLLNDHLLDSWRGAGFQLHVSKPFDAFEVLAVVETLVGQRIERRRRMSVQGHQDDQHRRAVATAL